jgi:L-amino acid N-acyltransferase YncA
MIREVTPDDAAAICGIYNHYIETSAATFEEKVLSVETMRERIVATTQTHPWLVLERDGVAVGYAYARPWHVRSAFRFTAETSVYLSPDTMGHGLGRLLYQALLAEIESRAATHCLIAAIALPNDPSVTLHESMGFTKVGAIPQAGRKFGRWIDMGYWQKMLASSFGVKGL